MTTSYQRNDPVVWTEHTPKGVRCQDAAFVKLSDHKPEHAVILVYLDGGGVKREIVPLVDLRRPKVPEGFET